MAANFQDIMNEFHPLYAEEIFIVNMYGTDEEIAAFEQLLEHRQKSRVQVEMIVICEEIIRRILTNMETPCCHKCQFYFNCPVNSIRHGRGFSTKCCSYCHNYRECLARFRGESVVATAAPASTASTASTASADHAAPSATVPAFSPVSATVP